MSKQEKLIKRLLLKPTDFEWGEAAAVLGYYGYEITKGSGSRRKFIHTKTRQLIILHEPHPKKVLKLYALEIIIEALKEGGYLK